MLHRIGVDQKDFHMQVPGHVGTWINETVDWAAKVVLDREPTDDLMPFSDLKPLTTKYRHQVWQKEWDETVSVSSNLRDI